MTLPPSLPLPLLLAILFAALLHAGWNALIKSGGDKSLDTALIHGLGVGLAVPAVLWFGLPSAAAWPYIAASTAIHVGYYTALAGAYRHGDLGLTYPVMRGCAPLMVAMASHTFIGEAISFGAWVGVAAICIGVITLGLSRASLNGNEAQRRKALGFALANAVIIALYTLIDGLGVRASGNAAAYVAALFLFDGIPYMVLVMWQKKPAARRAALTYMASRWRIAAIGTLASLGSYGIALWAMTRAPVLFAALIGTLVLGERFGWQRAVGTLIILAGVMLLRLS